MRRRGQGAEQRSVVLGSGSLVAELRACGFLFAAVMLRRWAIGWRVFTPNPLNGYLRAAALSFTNGLDRWYGRKRSGENLLTSWYGLDHAATLSRFVPPVHSPVV